MVNAPLLAKTTTFAASPAALAKLPVRDAGWLGRPPPRRRPPRLTA